MKKNEAPSDSRLKSIENESPDQKKPRASQPDSSIRNDKDPLPANGGPQFGRDDVHSNENAEFIDRDNNVTKVEGEK